MGSEGEKTVAVAVEKRESAVAKEVDAVELRRRTEKAEGREGGRGWGGTRQQVYRRAVA